MTLKFFRIRVEGAGRERREPCIKFWKGVNHRSNILENYSFMAFTGFMAIIVHIEKVY